MVRDWYDLTRVTRGSPFLVQRVSLPKEGLAIEGSFELPPLARLSAEDQVFVAAFVRCHGSIKQMQQWFGVSYPTVKNRLNRIGGQLGFVEVKVAESPGDVLAQLERGEISVQQALERLRK